MKIYSIVMRKCKEVWREDYEVKVLLGSKSNSSGALSLFQLSFCHFDTHEIDIMFVYCILKTCIGT